jgi:hypothetical protein
VEVVDTATGVSLSDVMYVYLFVTPPVALSMTDEKRVRAQLDDAGHAVIDVIAPELEEAMQGANLWKHSDVATLGV